MIGFVLLVELFTRQSNITLLENFAYIFLHILVFLVFYLLEINWCDFQSVSSFPSETKS